jgi:hypothetical protein
MSDMLQTARDTIAPVVENGLGPHGFYYSLVTNEPEETIELRGVPLTKVAGERYFLTQLKEVIAGTYLGLVPERLERIRRWMNTKHSEHLTD